MAFDDQSLRIIISNLLNSLVMTIEVFFFRSICRGIIDIGQSVQPICTQQEFHPPTERGHMNFTLLSCRPKHFDFCHILVLDNNFASDSEHRFRSLSVYLITRDYLLTSDQQRTQPDKILGDLPSVKISLLYKMAYPVAWPEPVFVRVLYYYDAEDTSCLKIRPGDIIMLLSKAENGWWDGLLGNIRGWFPSNYCVVLEPEESATTNDYSSDDEQATSIPSPGQRSS